MAGKFFVTGLDSALYFLERLEYEEGHDYLESSMEMMRQDLRFLRMLFWGLPYWEDLKYDWHLHYAINVVMPKLNQLAKELEEDCRCIEYQDQGILWEGVLFDLEKAIRQFKPQLKDICIALSGGDFRCTSCPRNQNSFLDYGRDSASFAHTILQNLGALHSSNLIAESAKQQIALVQPKMEEFGSFVAPENLAIIEEKKLYELMSHARTWSNRVSCLTCLFWIDQGKDDSLASIMETVLSDLLHKTMSCNISGVISSYFQRTTIPQLLAGYLDFLLRDLVIHMKDDIDVLHEGLIFLLSFIIDSPEDDSEDRQNGLIFLFSFMIVSPEDDDSEDRQKVWTQVYALINEFSSLVYSIRGEMEGRMFKAMFSDYLLKIDTLKAKVTNLYLKHPYSSSQFSTPSTGAIRFLNSVIGNLENMLEGEVNLIPSIKNTCELLVTELVLLRPVVFSVTEVLQGDECDKIQDLRTEIMSMMYNVDYFIKFLPARCFAAWYGIIALPSIIKHVNTVKTEIEDIGADKIFKKRKVGTHHELEEAENLPLSWGTTNRVFTGFGEVARVISEELTRGQRCLTIISISGSAGQGKTTLAKKIHDDRRIMYHFHKIVWCYVSKDCPTRELLVQIIGDDHMGVDVKGLEMHDLVDHLRKALKGRRYLIVLDDIWDVDAWRKLECSFPDDNNGSRLLFTSRNHDLASHAKASSISHRLPLFSTEESWELMQKMVFHSQVCPEEFVAVGNKISSYCKGLPLAVSLIAGVLGRTDQKLELWDGVAENLKSHLAREGCTNVIELSYKYLPHHLKPCFLYFGAFLRGESISVKKLKLLWIAEGFVDESSEDLATDYLNDLVSQSLVVVTERSSMDGIKRCNVHDLLYDMCLEKANEDNFLNWVEESLVMDERCDGHILHRLRVSTSTDPLIEPRPIFSCKKLPASPLHSLLWLGDAHQIRFPSFLGRSKFLTVLDIKRPMKTGSGSFPDVILAMMHLRYLALHLLVNICNIPPAIAKLRILETLIIGFTYKKSVLLPDSVLMMKRLRHVSVRYARLKAISDFSAACSDIERLGSVHLVVSDCRTAEISQAQKAGMQFQRAHFAVAFHGCIPCKAAAVPQNRSISRRSAHGWIIREKPLCQLY